MWPYMSTQLISVQGRSPALPQNRLPGREKGGTLVPYLPLPSPLPPISLYIHHSQISPFPNPNSSHSLLPSSTLIYPTTFSPSSSFTSFPYSSPFPSFYPLYHYHFSYPSFHPLPKPTQPFLLHLLSTSLPSRINHIFRHLLSFPNLLIAIRHLHLLYSLYLLNHYFSPVSTSPSLSTPLVPSSPSPLYSSLSLIV